MATETRKSEGRRTSIARSGYAFLAVLGLVAGAAQAKAQVNQGDVVDFRAGCLQQDAMELVAKAHENGGYERASMMFRDMVRSGLCFRAPYPVPVELRERVGSFRDPDGTPWEVWRAEMYSGQTVYLTGQIPEDRI